MELIDVSLPVTQTVVLGFFSRYYNLWITTDVNHCLRVTIHLHNTYNYMHARDSSLHTRVAQ